MEVFAQRRTGFNNSTTATGSFDGFVCGMNFSFHGLYNSKRGTPPSASHTFYSLTALKRLPISASSTVSSLRAGDSNRKATAIKHPAHFTDICPPNGVKPCELPPMPGQQGKLSGYGRFITIHSIIHLSIGKTGQQPQQPRLWGCAGSYCLSAAPPF